MIKRTFILLIFFLFLQFASGFAQTSAQTRMRVSVYVISGASIDFRQSQAIASLSSEASELGKIYLEGISSKNTLVSISHGVTITNRKGNSVNVSIARKQVRNGKTESIELWGSSNSKMIDGIYEGELIATIEYL